MTQYKIAKFRYADLVEGTTRTYTWKPAFADGGAYTIDSGTVRVFDADFNALTGFASAATADVSTGSLGLEYALGFGSGDGELRSIDDKQTCYVQWVAQIDGEPHTSPLVPIDLYPRAGD